jgi:uncharacterized LabA/DUF88 family protein
MAALGARAAVGDAGDRVPQRRISRGMGALCGGVPPRPETIIEDQEYSSIRPLIDWLDCNGHTVVTKPIKEFIDASGRRRVRGNMDIELAVDAMEMSEHVDEMVLFAGDGDFRSLVEAIQRRGVRVTVVSTISTQPAMIADELRRQADVFLDLRELQPRIRNPDGVGAREPGRDPGAAVGVDCRINQPISAVVMNAEAALRLLLAQPTDTEAVRRLLACIVKEGMRTGDIVNRTRALIKESAATEGMPGDQRGDPRGHRRNPR